MGILIVGVFSLILAAWVARDDLPFFNGSSDVQSAPATTEESTSTSTNTTTEPPGPADEPPISIDEPQGPIGDDEIETVIAGTAINCEPVILRSGVALPERVECASGALIVTGDREFDWNTDLSGWELDGDGRVDGHWEEWRESSPGANDWSLFESGLTPWTESGEHVDGDQANDRYQELNIVASEGFTLTIWQDGGRSGASATFTFVSE